MRAALKSLMGARITRTIAVSSLALASSCVAGVDTVSQKSLGAPAESDSATVEYRTHWEPGSVELVQGASSMRFSIDEERMELQVQTLVQTLVGAEEVEQVFALEPVNDSSAAMPSTPPTLRANLLTQRGTLSPEGMGALQALVVAAGDSLREQSRLAASASDERSSDEPSSDERSSDERSADEVSAWETIAGHGYQCVVDLSPRLVEEPSFHAGLFTAIAIPAAAFATFGTAGAALFAIASLTVILCGGKAAYRAAYV